jgi:cell division protein FtsI (penicillin-binding protein 3)
VSDLTSDAPRPVIRQRLFSIAVIVVLWATAIQARLVYLQVYDHDDLVTRAERQQKRSIELAAKRGEIVDRAGRMLAYSVDVDSIYAVPSEITDPRQVVRQLCLAMRDGCDADQRSTLLERLSRRRPFAWVRRQVSSEDSRRVKALDLDGIGFMKESRRFYPNTSLAAHVLGYVGLDNEGLAGIEGAYDGTIRGKNGTALVQNDARRHVFSRTERPPTTGASVELTIDSMLQYMVERALQDGVDAHRAKGATAIVMDPWTGEILAMASSPTFNPNAFARVTDSDVFRNLATQLTYEPGSTFKTVTAAAALEEKVMRPTDIVDVTGGYIKIGARRVNDTHSYGALSFTDVIVKSSNVGAIKIGFRLGAERLMRYVHRFGFGRSLSPDFRGEESGLVWSQLTDSALASVSMGYQIGVTPLQMVTAVSSIANGGRLLEPHVVRAIRRPEGRTVVQPKVLGQTITSNTAAELTTIMEGVVERGTAKVARIDGFTIAGKTGTAAKLVNGAYSKSEYRSSFVGFFPSRKPVVAVLVVVDTPRTGVYYGGVVAGPIFKNIAEAAIRHLGIPPSIDPQPPVMVVREREPEAVPAAGPVRMPDLVQVRRANILPDVRGMSARDAVAMLARLGVRPRIKGSGYVVDQQPVAGTPLDDAAVCDLRLARAVHLGGAQP